MLKEFPKHAPDTPNGCANMTIHPQALPNGLVQHSQLSIHNNGTHHNLSQFFMAHDNATSNQPSYQPPLLMMQHFEEVFWERQQQIQAQHVLLEAKMQAFFTILKQRQDNISQHDSSATARNPMIDTRYLRPAIFKYFFEVYCSPTLPKTPWHQWMRWLNLQNIQLSVSTFSSNYGRQSPDDKHRSVLLTPMTIRAVPWPTPTAPTKPTFSNDHLSSGKRPRPLTRPMISYCPPWLPPHWKCWYSTNIDLNLQRSQPKAYMNTQYYQWHTKQYSVDFSTSTTADNSYSAPPAPTASEKNLLRPP